MSFSRKRNLRSVNIEVEMVRCKNCLNSDCSSYKCIKKYKCTSSAMASQRHMACKSSKPAQNIGGKNPVLAKTSAKFKKLQATAQNSDTVEESNNFVLPGSHKNIGSKIPVAVKTAKIGKLPAVTRKISFMEGSNNFKGFFPRLTQPITEAIDLIIEPIEPTPEPIEPTPEPIEPTPEPIEPTPEPIEPTPEPIEPTPEPIEPTTEPIEPNEAATGAKVIEQTTEPNEPIIGLVSGAHGFLKSVDSVSKLHGVELPVKKVDHIKKFQQLLHERKFFDEQVNTYGEMYCGKDFKEMVRLTARKILDDEFLKDYSFLGRTKLPLIEYNKVIDLIIKAVAKRYGNIEEETILKYFKDDYIKGAPGRCKKSSK